MSTRTDLATIQVATPLPEAADGDGEAPTQRGVALLGPVAVACAIAAVVVVARGHRFGAADAIRLVLAVAFAAAGMTLVRQRQMYRLGVVTLAAVTVASVEFLAAAWVRRSTDVPVAEAIESIAATLVVAIAFQLLLTLPEGRFPSPSARNLAITGYVTAVAVGLVRWSQQPDPAPLPIALLAIVACLAGFAVAHHSYGEAHGVTRQRMQWLGLAFAMCAEASLVLVALRVLTGWPSRPAPAAAASLVLVAGALIGASSPRLVGRVDRLLSHTVSIAGLSAIVTTIYLCVVIGLGRVPTDDDKRVIALSIAAAVVAALAYVSARERLTVIANRLVYGDERDPGEALDTFGSRLTRALPMEELLLQLAELCKKHMGLKSSEVWTGVGGQMTLAASVPDRGEQFMELDAKQLPVVTRARVSGRGWAEVWMPQLIDGSGGPLQVVPMTHSGQLFGLLVLEREQGDDDFNEEEGRVVTELARQVALALHNSELDTALRATLDEVQRKNVELQESRARIVATADAERRKIERNLHDGAQQHLVALAVKIRLIQRVGEKDPGQAIAMLEEARDAALATVEELRPALAHGIYPPLLMANGLADALRAAAGRSPLPTTVEAGDNVGRYPQDVEAAVYFCCLEALQNAGKHAGEGASVTITVEHVDGELRFAVRDDGAGFDTKDSSHGHGFVNMADRLGAIGGTASVTSAPGDGTCVSGRVPALAVAV